MVRQESDRCDHQTRCPLFVQAANVIEDVGFQPWISRATTAALIDQFPSFTR